MSWQRHARSRPFADFGAASENAVRTVEGRARVAKFISSFAGHFWVGSAFRWLETNGRSSVLISRDGEPIALATIDAGKDGIHRIYWVMAPAKLSRLSQSS
jgi:RNA polymerase sigma-70 factor (ECF subfamily)